MSGNVRYIADISDKAMNENLSTWELWPVTAAQVILLLYMDIHGNKYSASGAEQYTRAWTQLTATKSGRLQAG